MKWRLKWGEVSRGLALVSQLGLTMAVCIFVGVFLGHFLDNITGLSPLFLILFILIGFIAAIKALYDATMNHFNKK